MAKEILRAGPTKAPISPTFHAVTDEFRNGRIVLYPSHAVFGHLQGLHRRVVAPVGVGYPSGKSRRAYERILCCVMGTYITIPDPLRLRLIAELFDYVTAQHSFDGLESLFFTSLPTLFAAQDKTLFSRAMTLWQSLGVPSHVGINARSVPVFDSTHDTFHFIDATMLPTLAPRGKNSGMVRGALESNLALQMAGTALLGAGAVQDAEGCQTAFRIGGMVVGAISGGIVGFGSGTAAGSAAAGVGAVPGGIAGAVGGVLGGAGAGAAAGKEIGSDICGWAYSDTQTAGAGGAGPGGATTQAGSAAEGGSQEPSSSLGGSDPDPVNGGDSGGVSIDNSGSSESSDKGKDQSDDSSDKDKDNSSGSSDGSDDKPSETKCYPDPYDPNGFASPGDPLGVQLSTATLATGNLTGYMKQANGSVQLTSTPRLAVDGATVASKGFLANAPAMKTVMVNNGLALSVATQGILAANVRLAFKDQTPTAKAADTLIGH